MGLFGTLLRGTAQVTASATAVTGNMLWGAVQKARTRREVRGIMNQAAEANYNARDVAVLPGLDKQLLALTSADPQDNDIYDYTSQSQTPGLDFIWGQDPTPEGLVVSGGGNDQRVRALMPFVDKAQTNNLPVIALHTGNQKLAAMVGQRSRACEHVHASASYYDVFRGMPVGDIAYLLYGTMDRSTTTAAAEALLQAAVEVLLLTDGVVTAEKLAALSLPTLNDQIDKLHLAKAIPTDQYQELSRYFMSGSAETNAVRIFLNQLARQIESVYGRMGTRSCNIKKMLNMAGSVTIDVGLANNDLLTKLLINHLLLLESQGRDFAIILDNVPISRYPQLMDVLRSRRYAISHDDVVSSLFGGARNGDDLFAEITGNVKTAVVFHHNSGTACQKWSDYFGKYHKIRVRFNVSQNTAFLNTSNSHGISVDETDEARVRAETLSRLPPNAACVYSAGGILITVV